jgi:diguanylate cyclase (GGDEF)-like protein
MIAFQEMYQRLAKHRNPECPQAAIRLAIVSTAMIYFHSSFFVQRSLDTANVYGAHLAVTAAFVVTVGFALAVFVRPGPSVTRRILGVTHDIAAISIAMFLGEEAAAPVAAIYLWVAIGNGFRYGNRYLYSCAILSIAGFGAVYYCSDYWQQQGVLSFNIFMLLVIVPPYVGALLSSLNRAKAQLKRQASFDSLTGLLNRAEFERSVGELMARDHSGHVLLFCDLDHFKQVNDAAGHAAGDALLADIARIIADNVRDVDLCSRLGGDEFCVFLERCPLEKAREIAEKIRADVASYRLAWGRDYYSVGISIGVAPSSAVKDRVSLFRLADAATYAAKNAGRNQIHVVDPRIDNMDIEQVRRLFVNPDIGITLSGEVIEKLR